jgi:hypothetical protein
MQYRVVSDDGGERLIEADSPDEAAECAAALEFEVEAFRDMTFTVDDHIFVVEVEYSPTFYAHRKAAP